MNKKLLSYLLLLTTFITTSCSSINKSIALGVSTGVITGASIGGIKTENKSKNQLKGALIGALVVGVASYFTHKSIIKRDERVRKRTLFNLEKFGIMGINESNASYKIPFAGQAQSTFLKGINRARER